MVDDALVMRGVISGLLKDHHDVVGDAANGRDAVRLAGELKPDIIVMDVTMPIMDGIEATRQITAKHPGIDVVILSAMSSGENVKAGMAAGARDYLFKPPKPEEILEVLARLTRQRAERGSVVEATQGATGKGIWTFLSPKGGDGCTTLMLSVANELLAMGRSVAVLDADPVFGDVGLYLNIDAAAPTLSEILNQDGSLSDPNVARALKSHPSGLKVLAKPALGKPAVHVPPEKLIEVAHLLLRSHDAVLVDIPSGLPERYLPLLDDSTLIFPIGRGLPESVKNLKLLVDLLEMCGFKPPRVVPLLTRAEPEALAPIVKGIRLTVAEYFPNDPKAVEEATREAQPVSRVAPRSAYTQKVRDFLAQVLRVAPAETAPAAAAAAPGLLQRLLGKS